MKKTERKTKITQVKQAGKSSGPLEPDSSSPSNSDAENEAKEFPSLSEIKELIEFVSKKQFNEFELERGGLRLRWRSGINDSAASLSEHALQAPSPTRESATIESVSTAPAAAQPAPAPQEEKLHIIASPIVGTFYRSSSPTAEPFIKLGEEVESGKTLCIIEAMKLMNEIPSDTSGTIAKIFVENGQPVEYGQPLFGIKV